MWGFPLVSPLGMVSRQNKAKHPFVFGVPSLEQKGLYQRLRIHDTGCSEQLTREFCWIPPKELHFKVY